MRRPWPTGSAHVRFGNHGLVAIGPDGSEISTHARCGPRRRLGLRLSSTKLDPVMVEVVSVPTWGWPAQELLTVKPTLPNALPRYTLCLKANVPGRSPTLPQIRAFVTRLG